MNRSCNRPSVRLNHRYMSFRMIIPRSIHSYLLASQVVPDRFESIVAIQLLRMLVRDPKR